MKKSIVSSPWLAIAVGLLIYIPFLGRKSLWLDEANSIRLAKFGQEAYWAGLVDWFHPPLYFAFLERWIQVSESEFWVRLPAALFMLAVIGLVIVFGRTLFNNQIAQIAGWLTALSPLLYWYATEARHYSELAFWTLLFLYTTLRFAQGNKWRWWGIGTITLIISLYWHYLAGLLLPLQLLLLAYLIANERAHFAALKWWGTSWLIAIVAYLPWLRTPTIDTSLELLADPNNHFARLLVQRVGISADLSSLLPILGISLLFMPVLFYLVYRLTLITLQKKWHQHPLLPLVIFALFILSLIVFAIPRAYTIKRQIVMVWPLFLLVIAWFWQHNQRLTNVALLLSLVVVGVNVFTPKTEWRELAEYLSASEANAPIWIEPDYMTIPFDYYEPQLESIGSAYGIEIKEVPEQVWFVTHSADFDPNQQTYNHIASHATPTDTITFHNLTATLFTRNP